MTGHDRPPLRPVASLKTMPAPGTARSVGGTNKGRPADIRNARHYPLEAVCAQADGSVCGCGQIIRSETYFDAWHHTGRAPER